MLKTVILSHDYPFSTADVWAIATDYDDLADIMAGIVTFTGLPSGRTKTGDQMNVEFRLFGKFPPQPYFMEVLECDDANMILRSSEQGGGVKSWFHTLTVITTDQGARLTDHIVLDAGLMTPIFAIWAKFMYRKRHQPRLAMLQARQQAISKV